MPPGVPGVVTWYRVYCGALAVVYLALVVGGVAFMFFSDRIAQGDDEVPQWFGIVYGAVLIVLGLVFLSAYLAAFFLPAKPWVWIYGIVLISIGFTSACCLPFSIVLLIFWLKPECKVYFGRPA
jgi:MFS family permease